MRFQDLKPFEYVARQGPFTPRPGVQADRPGAPPPDSTSDDRTQQRERLVFGAPRGPDLRISKIQILNFRVRSTLERIERMIERMIERNDRVLESNNVASCPRSQNAC
ncbi:hypothetical protein PAPYR_6775 [Paratrimastix pyriformis]|uniref:Uncharacterized protein n=1 Tax=Paratrimastix pyriformis TaxID=342808 RepID=A0ABQ8UH41_9EUKA|nr:hypothetical protein PAPYR_6775 [Paratrimastix pyriformis]